MICFCGAALAVPTPPDPASVAVLYNSSSADSKALAEFYAKARNIPADHLVGLELPDSEEISRKDFDDKLRNRLIREYDRREWWVRGRGADGKLVPTELKIRILVCMRGVPSRVTGTGPALPPPAGEQPFTRTTQASVDSELALLGVEGVQVEAVVNNPYFKQEKTIAEAKLPMTLVGRIDGPTKEVCARMIKDAVEAENTGLWGMSVIDLSQMYPEHVEGDPAMEKVAKAHRDAGIPVIIDRNKETLPLNYPLRDTALYFGWYDWNINGPFVNQPFKFKKGAVAAHLHSFSAGQLRDTTKNWCAGLLSKGAAATLGNVYEPYLPLTHNFDIFNDRLMAGYTLVEAAYMSVPVLSWQNVVLGDPLYRPFLHLDGGGEKADEDRDYRALRLANLRWKEDPKQLDAMLLDAADRLKSGTLVEAVGLSRAARKEEALATADFRKAKLYFADKPDRLRMDLHLATMAREAGKKSEAIDLLRGARTLYADIPEVIAPATWAAILEPPPAQPQPPKK
ncbi:TIGR03790 family protein [Luteolibacter flavescens]|uniref:TIGR03790 family protein n=1 Tax=Luteolibacter flavescens TaxID=1859460 RepID=A0ABT3FMV0_9BACT|nr:TIGR03790 family protein [Luteolibacter flavescens]MCW1884305.1 TIGR03790 family protein [Luteolibacter flavescens]